MASPGVPDSPIQLKAKKSIMVTEQPKFDLESYLQNYKGRTRLERLLLIGTTSTAIGLDALKLAVQEAKTGRDIKRYLSAQINLHIISPEDPDGVRDMVWIENTERQNKAETTRLEAELKGYKNNLIKESIRMGNEDLGKHYQAIGDLPKAFEAFSRMRQDVSLAKHIVDVSRHLIGVAIEQNNWMVVLSNVTKIRSNNMSNAEDDKFIQPYLSTAEGLAYMDSRDYSQAARAFLSTEAGMGSSENIILSANDVAVYGGLCALATMDRNELTTKVLENSNFRTYLELEPHIRRAIGFFVNSRYSACLNTLEAYRTDYLLDIYLRTHVDELYSMVRNKSIVQYLIPFSCVTLDSLNSAFSVSGTSIEKELCKMIDRKELDARVDTQNKLLVSVPTAARATLHNEALQTVKAYEREAHRRLQHMNIIGAELDLRSKKGINSSTAVDESDWGANSGRQRMRPGGF